MAYIGNPLRLWPHVKHCIWSMSRGKCKTHLVFYGLNTNKLIRHYYFVTWTPKPSTLMECVCSHSCLCSVGCQLMNDFFAISGNLGKCHWPITDKAQKHYYPLMRHCGRSTFRVGSLNFPKGVQTTAILLRFHHLYLFYSYLNESSGLWRLMDCLNWKQ